MVSATPLLGCLLHAFGAFFAAMCYTPQSKIKGWSRQTYRLAQALICWLIGPDRRSMVNYNYLGDQATTTFVQKDKG